LNFDLDLSQVTGEILHRCSTAVPDLIKIGLIVFEKSQRGNERTNQHVITASSSGDNKRNYTVSQKAVQNYTVVR